MDFKNIMQKTLIFIFIGLIAAGSFYFIKSSFRKRPDLNIISASGRIEGDEYNAVSKFSGKIQEILVDEGDDVLKGRLIARLYSRQAQESLKSQEQEIKIWENKLKQANLAFREASQYTIAAINQNIIQAKANILKAKSILDYAQEEYTRYKILNEESAIAKIKFEEIKSKFKIAREEYNVAKIELDKLIISLKNNISINKMQRAEDIENTKAMLKQAEANYSIAKENLADYKIFSPTNGRVVEKIVQTGEVIAAGTPIVTIINMDKLYLRIFLPTEESGKIKIGNTAKIIPDALDGESFDAVVYKIADKAEFTPKNVETKEQRIKLVFEVKLKILENKYKKLKPGMPSEAQINIDKTISFK